MQPPEPGTKQTNQTDDISGTILFSFVLSLVLFLGMLAVYASIGRLGWPCVISGMSGFT